MNEFNPNEFFVTYKEKDYSFIEWMKFLADETDHLQSEKAIEKLNEIMDGVEQKFKDLWYLEKWGCIVKLEDATQVRKKIDNERKKYWSKIK